MKRATILVFGLLQCMVLGAQNLVPNAGFEQFDGQKQSLNWSQAEGEFNHFYHANIQPNVGTAATGKGYHCLCMYSRDENEFMHVQLTHRLEKGKVYELRMMVRMSNASDAVYKNEKPGNMKTIDWYFTSIPLNVHYKLFITAEPSVSFPFQNKPYMWTEFSTEYAATGDESYLTIGNLTRIYDKIKADEALDSLHRLYMQYELTESRLCDSVRQKYIVQLDRTLLNEGSEMSMNPYVEKSKRKKMSKRRQKAYDAELEKSKRVGATIGYEQQGIRKKYERLRRDVTDEAERQKKLYAVNVCFDDLSITEIPGKYVSPPDPLLSLPAVTGNTLVLKNVYFNTDSYELLPASYPELEKLVLWLNQHPQAVIQVSGHTDITGREKQNLELSANRAAAVARYLQEHGISAQRMRTAGYAAKFPLADNMSEAGRALNRRVEFTVL